MRRIIVAIAVGIVVSLAFYVVSIDPIVYLCEAFIVWVAPSLGSSNVNVVGCLIVFFLVIPGLVSCALLARRKRPGDGETRCRKCDYILRGITEPRCPECGEPI